MNKIFLCVIFFCGIHDLAIADGGVWLDVNTKLMWSKCGYGQIWRSDRCTGVPKRLNWIDAHIIARDSNYEGYSDWRMPTLAEYNSIYRRIQVPNRSMGGYNNTTEYINSFITPIVIGEPLNGYSYMEYEVWVSLPSNKNDMRGTYVNMANGKVETRIFGADLYARFVRSDSDGVINSSAPVVKENLDYAIKFNAELENKRREELAEKERQRQFKLAEQARQEKEEEDNRRAWHAVLNQKDPQAMYLMAGKLMRNGYTTKARELYEAIIERHAKTVWAVKASDQLDKKAQEDSAIESIERANSSARQNCNAQKQTCIASCPKDSVLKNQPDTSCRWRCESVSCN